MPSTDDLEPLDKAVRQVLHLFGYEASAPHLGRFAGRRVTFWQIHRKGDGEDSFFTIDHLDSPEIVLWAIQQFETVGAIKWDMAPYTDEWRTANES